jgi:hypothetical protein
MVTVRTNLILGLGSCAVILSSLAIARQAPAQSRAVPQWFQTSDRCQACHNGLRDSAGNDVSLGVEWRASMMAQASRDPYWQAAVRREVLDHPAAADAIEHECSRCHMPMAHVTAVSAGGRGQVFAEVPTAPPGPHAALAADGVSCTVCHQILKDNLGKRESFTGHFLVDSRMPPAGRAVFGPFPVTPGLQRVMQSATGMRPEHSPHIQSAELCATCHTLFTHALGADGKVIGELAEQVPYLEWRHSAYRESRSCQDCHMPLVQGAVPIASTMGAPRNGVSRHTFRGSNFWMLKLLDRYRTELAVTTASDEMQEQAQDSIAHLQRESATLALENVTRADGGMLVEVVVKNKAGHKLPTAYPSRRVWLHLSVRDANGRVAWESGAFTPDGSIAGNDNDANASAFEPHHVEITRADQVQIFETIMVDQHGAVTTGLLKGVRYVKDNRLLPDGFDKSTADGDVAVQGDAAGDPDFTAGQDRVRYRIPITGAGPVTIEAELLYQSIGRRWAENLRLRPAAETDRFVRYYGSMAAATVERLATASARLP